MHVQHPCGSYSPQVDISRGAAVRTMAGGGIAALLLAGGARPGRLAAQQATPTGAVGISMQSMGTGQPASAPGLELTLRRTVIAVGGRLPAHSHPGALVIFVESGAFGYTALGGTVQLTRAAGAGTPTPAEPMPVGTEVILNSGDWIFVEDPQDDIRNAGKDDVVLLVAGLTGIGEPFTSFMSEMDMDATPGN